MAADLTMTGKYPHFDEEEVLFFSKKRILLIEEDWDFSQLLSSLLSRHLDIEVEAVKNPYQALSRMLHEPYDVLVMDSKLNPYQALIEAEQYLQPLLEEEFEELEKVPVIVLTDNTDLIFDGMESHYFKIISSVIKEPAVAQTVRQVENELNDLLDL